MSRLFVKYIVTCVPLLLVLSCGLNKANVNEPLPADQLAQALTQSFQSADASAQAAVAKIIAETQSNEIAASFTDIKALAAMPNLTKNQQVMAIRASHTIGQKLQEAVQNGDEKAAETMHSYNVGH